MSGRITKTPLAWSNLTHDLKRLAASLAGVGFAVVLIFTELGFLNAMLDATVAPLEKLQRSEPGGTLLVINRNKETLTDALRFASKWLVKAEAVPDVLWARALYFETAVSDFHNPKTHVSRKIRVLSSDSEDLLSELAAGVEAGAQLRPSGTALFDRRSQTVFGFEELWDTSSGSTKEAWVARKPLRLVGMFDLGTDFVNGGNLLVGFRTFDSLFPTRQVNRPDAPMVDIGVIRLVEGADAMEVRAGLERSQLADAGLRFLTVKEMIGQEQAFWQIHTPIGQIFWLGVILGFIVGMVICYQVLSSDIRDHLAEYATLKAIGYGDRYLVNVVCRQALWLALLGFVPATLCAEFVYSRLSGWTGLPMEMAPNTVGLVLILTLAMCLSSAYFAIRKLFQADPAELF
jgi:putative ABC transport system permease protein